MGWTRTDTAVLLAFGVAFAATPAPAWVQHDDLAFSRDWGNGCPMPDLIADAARDQFCADPYKYVCDTNDSVSKLRDRMIDSGMGGYFGNFQGIASTLAHETGHIMDFGYFPQEHKALHDCIQSNFPQVGGKFSGDKDRERRYMQEISADNWAAEALAKIVDDIRDPSQSLHFVRYTLRSYCGFGDNGEDHPSDRLRIKILFARNPRLRKALGCMANTKEAPGCALEGAVPAK